jgi:hypothetical protein
VTRPATGDTQGGGTDTGRCGSRGSGGAGWGGVATRGGLSAAPRQMGRRRGSRMAVQGTKQGLSRASRVSSGQISGQHTATMEVLFWPPLRASVSGVVQAPWGSSAVVASFPGGQSAWPLPRRLHLGGARRLPVPRQCVSGPVRPGRPLPGVWPGSVARPLLSFG